MSVDKVLIEIITAANMAGVEQAKAGMLGMNPATLGLAAGLGVLVAAGKFAIDTAKQQTEAENGLDIAIRNRHGNEKRIKDDLYAFIQANRDYISNQFDVINSTAALVRQGTSLRDIQRDQNIILDLAAAKNLSLADATEIVLKAQAGQFKGLKDITGLQLDAIGKGDTYAEKQKKIGHNLDIVAKATDGARKKLDPMQESLNSLKITGQEYATGPGKQLNDAFAAGIGILDLFGQALLKIGKNDALWAPLNDQLVETAQNARKLALALGIAQPTKQEISDRGQADYLYNNPGAKFIQDTPGYTVKEYEKMIAASNAANLKSHNDMLAIQKKIDDGNKAFRDFATVIRDRKSELIVNVNVPPASDPRFNQNHQYRQLVGV